MHIVGNVVKSKGKEELFGFEVAQLEDAIDLDFHPPEGEGQVVLRLGEGKVVGALVSGEAGSPMERFDFLVVEDPLSFGWCVGLRDAHACSA